MLPDMSDTDMELLARYTRCHAEDDFSEIVRRHLDLVHSAALRQVRCTQLAKDVAQSVPRTVLAEKRNKSKNFHCIPALILDLIRLPSGCSQADWADDTTTY